MPITNPDLFDRPIASRTGTLSASSQIKNTDDTSVQDAITELRNTPPGQGDTFSDGMRDLNSHITAVPVAGAAWQAAANPTPHRNATISRAFAALWTENQRSAAGNFFDDLADPTITVPNEANIHFFADALDSGNRFQGKQSWVDSTFRVNGSPLTARFEKIIAFSALIPETFTDPINLFAAGDDPAQGVLRVAMVGGTPRLQARRGALDGATENHSIRRFLTLLNQDLNAAHWVGNATNSSNFVVRADDPIPPPGGSYLVQVRRYENGAFTGGESFTIAIPDRDTDVAEATTMLFSNELTVTYSYDANFNNGGTPTDLIRLSTNDAGDADVSYVVQIPYSITESVQQSSTSDYETINNIQIGTEIDLIFIFEKQNAENTNANAPLQLKINVNGISDSDVALNLGANDFDFTDLLFGATADCLISQIQIYEFTAPQPFDFPTHSILATFFQRRLEWLGLFRHPNLASRNYDIDGGLILNDINGTSYNVIQLLEVAGLQQLNVFQATSRTALANVVTLPANYTDFDYMYVVELHSDNGTPEWRQTLHPVSLLGSSDLLSTDLIRLQGNSDLQFNNSNRELTLIPFSAENQEIYLVRLIQLGAFVST